jgi:tripartite-type tricarboxylate transporter receptor subunit TctC
MFDATAAAAAHPAVAKALENGGTEVAVSKSPEEFSAFVAADAKFWTQIVKIAGVKAD